MKLYKFDYRLNRAYGDALQDLVIVDILSGDGRAKIVYDTELKLGDFALPKQNSDFGVNYGSGGKMGFVHDSIEYVVNHRDKEINVSLPNKPTANLFFDADKRDSFEHYKIEFSSIDDVLLAFIQKGYVIRKV